ncbi:MAG: hypothetical protein R3C60_06570 [Parvularculaceae bacterium]
MSSAIAAMFLAAAIFAAALAYGAGRFLATQSFLADLPNHRSAHSRPTPRSGGVAIFIGWMTAMIMLSVFFEFTGVASPWPRFMGLAAAAFVIGLIDDWKTLPALLKLALEVALAVSFVILTGAVASLGLPFIVEAAISVFWIVSFMNAYNFMDGINGIAAAAAIFVLAAVSVASAGAGLVLWAAAALVLAFAILGFLPLNIPKARLFMGDGGSLFIGFVVSAFAVILSAEAGGAVSGLFVPTAFMAFLFDVAFTLGHRAMRRRNLLAAHHEHLYQLMARQGRSHVSVSAIYLMLTAFSTIIAIFANDLGGLWPYFAPAFLFAVFMAPALRIYQQSKKSGFFDAKKTRRNPILDVATPEAAE